MCIAMIITLNGSATTLDSRCTVQALLEERGLAGRPAAVEVNGFVVPRTQHDTHELRDGDRIEIVTLVGGG